MTLPLDVPRCAGRYDFDPDGEWCPERMSCERYRAWMLGDEEAGIEHYKGIPVTMAQRDCTDKIEVGNEMQNL
ncbi:hypothetical protein MnBA_11960 [Marinobacterium sp. BA1]